MCPHCAPRRRCSHPPAPPPASHSTQPVPLGGDDGSIPLIPAMPSLLRLSAAQVPVPKCSSVPVERQRQSGDCPSDGPASRDLPIAPRRQETVVVVGKAPVDDGSRGRVMKRTTRPVTIEEQEPTIGD